MCLAFLEGEADPEALGRLGVEAGLEEGGGGVSGTGTSLYWTLPLLSLTATHCDSTIDPSLLAFLLSFAMDDEG